MLVILPVELCDSGIGVGAIVPELLFRFPWSIASAYKIVSIVEFFQGGIFFTWGSSRRFIHGDTPALFCEAASNGAIETFTYFVYLLNTGATLSPK